MHPVPHTQICAWSTCETCKVPFSHLNPVTLRRLGNVPELLDALPFDHEWPFGDVYLHRVHTSALEYDAVTRQGAANVIEKLTKLAAESVQLRVERYLDHGQIWASQLAAVVGDAAWVQLTLSEQFELASLRGEGLFFGSTPAPLAPLGAGGGRRDAQRWNVPELGRGVLHEKMLAALENRREHREAQMCAVATTEVLAIDWCNHTGKSLGGKCLANVVNEHAVLVRSRVTGSESIEELKPTLVELAKQPDCNVRVIVIDKVPPSLDEHAVSKLEAMILGTMPTLEKVMQDRFHVAHNLSKHFNNADVRYTSLVIRGWRDATVVRDNKREAAVDEGLRAGLIARERKGVRIVRGQKLSMQEITELKESGAYHDLFSTRDCLVPEHVKDADALRPSVNRWAEEVINACFHPAEADGVRRPILINGKALISTVQLVRKHATNALKRILNCIPPPDMPAWREVGLDVNGYTVWKPRFHTCSCESWNSAQPDFVAGCTATKELAQGCFLEGNTKRIVAKQVELGQQEDLGLWDVRRALRINQLAGHGAEADGMARLTHLPPLAVAAPPPKPPDAVCIQPLGRLDVRATKPLPTEVALRTQVGAPCARPAVPPSVHLALPQLAKLPLLPAGSQWLQLQGGKGGESEEEEDDELDPSQLDSPNSRRLLAAAGVDDVQAASPGLLSRAWSWAMSTGKGASTSNDASSSTDPVPCAAAPAPTPAPAAIDLPPPPLVSPPIARPMPLTLKPASGGKRTLSSADPETRRLQANKRSKANSWWCTCQPQWPAGAGRQWHESQCPRRRFAEGTIAAPVVGETVVCMQCAGPRAGQTWRCKKVAKDGWELVAPDE